jgi:hypothetical protein
MIYIRTLSKCRVIHVDAIEENYVRRQSGYAYLCKGSNQRPSKYEVGVITVQPVIVVFLV